MFEYISLRKIEPVPYCFSAFRDRTDVNVSWIRTNGLLVQLTEFIILNRCYIITPISGLGNPYAGFQKFPLLFSIFSYQVWTPFAA